MIPKAFTEKGLYMLATILKSPKAVETTLAVVETFAKLRELARTVEQLSNCDDKHEQASLINQSGELLDDIITRTVTRQTVETSFEINMAMVKVKRLVKKEQEQSVGTNLEEAKPQESHIDAVYCPPGRDC